MQIAGLLFDGNLELLTSPLLADIQAAADNWVNMASGDVIDPSMPSLAGWVPVDMRLSALDMMVSSVVAPW